MTTLRIPISGRLLVAHLAAYGLGFALDVAGEQAFVSHDPDSLELDPQVSTTADLERVANSVRRTGTECEGAVEADLVGDDSGSNRRPVAWARGTSMERARVALHAREELLDGLESGGARVATSLLTGLGAPATWLGDKPQRGASRLDGVPGNSTSDFVRGVLRRARPAAFSVTAENLRATIDIVAQPSGATDEDKTGWAPPGTRVDLVYQWLAAVGLSQLPVGLAARGPSRTPCHRRDNRGVTLPVLAPPVSMPRLRALLQLPELVEPDLRPASAARIRALGSRELLFFPMLGRSNDKMVAFSFGTATRIEL